MFDTIDATGTGRKSDPRMRNVEAEMIRSENPLTPITRDCWKNCSSVH